MTTIKRISKSDFIRYLECPRYAWLWKNLPELREEYQSSRIAQQGYEVEQIARSLFESGTEAVGINEEAHAHTLKLMEHDVNVLYQATFLSSQFLAKVDILRRDPGGKGWHLYEVKSATEVKSDHLADLCFQVAVLQESGINLASINLVYVTNEYIFDESKGIEPEKFLKIETLSRVILELLDQYTPKIQTAFEILNQENEPKVPALKKTFKYPLPDKLFEYYWKDVPEYSIYDIAYIKQPQLEELEGKGILKIEDVPEGYFSDRMNRQVTLTKNRGQEINVEEILKELNNLTFPLYFLDYETINPGIPLFDGTHPYQQIPFQYSVHVIEGPGSKVRHTDFLHTEKTNPIPFLLENLRRDIGDTGSILVWNQGFEKRCNEEMGAFCPEYRDFLASVNDRVFDLMVIFQGLYLDYRFKGSWSIKKVLPVLVPELSYEGLDIQDGGMAMDGALGLVEGSVGDREELIQGLRDYCELDTLSMVKIFEFLSNL